MPFALNEPFLKRSKTSSRRQPCASGARRQTSIWRRSRVQLTSCQSRMRFSSGPARPTKCQTCQMRTRWRCTLRNWCLRIMRLKGVRQCLRQQRQKQQHQEWQPARWLNAVNHFNHQKSTSDGVNLEFSTFCRSFSLVTYFSLTLVDQRDSRVHKLSTELDNLRQGTRFILSSL